MRQEFFVARIFCGKNFMWQIVFFARSFLGTMNYIRRNGMNLAQNKGNSMVVVINCSRQPNWKQN